MNTISGLTTILAGIFVADKRRIDCLVKMIMALILAETVNLTRLACIVFGHASQASHYRRLQRFFSEFRFDYNILARLIFTLFGFSEGAHYLVLDRTNWQWGKRDINILMLCVAYKKIGIPIFWILLNKKGNSSTRERAALMNRFIKVFGKENIAGLLGDREFIGKDWFSYLQKQGLKFYFRIKKDADTHNACGKSVQVSWLFYDSEINVVKKLKGLRPVYGHKLFISGMRLSDGEYLIVVSNSDERCAIEVYGLRWEIETLFGCLKSKGFRFEETRLMKHDRIKKMIGLLALAFCIAHKTGEWRHEAIKAIVLKKHGRPQYNYFRYGMNWIKEKWYQSTQTASDAMTRLVGFFKEMQATGMLAL
jgi:hypothetical protein